MGDLHHSKTYMPDATSDDVVGVGERSALLRRSKSLKEKSKQSCEGASRFSEIDLVCPKTWAVQNAMNAGGMVTGHDGAPAVVARIGERLERRLERLRSRTGQEEPTETVEKEKIPAVVPYVYALAFLVMIVQMSVTTLILLYCNSRGWTSSTNIRFFASLSLAGVAVPIVGNLLAGQWSAQTSPKKAMLGMIGLTGLGILLMITSESSYLFLAGYILFSLNSSIRIVRLTLLAAIVPKSLKTYVLANHALATPVGAMFGPILWLLCLQFRGDVGLATVLPGLFDLRLNRFTLCMSISLLTVIAMMVLVSIKFPEDIGKEKAVEIQETAKSTGTTARPSSSEHRVTFHVSGQREEVDLNQFRRNSFVYFCLIMFLMNFSAGFYQVGFQPVLVDYFEVSESSIGAIFEIIALLAIIPPILIAVLSRTLEDRQLMLIGILVKLSGMIIYSVPLGPRMYTWQVVVGNVLIIKASIFFFTSCMSLFTKILGPLGGGAWIGILSSVSASGPAIAQLLALDLVLQLFGKPIFVLFSTGAVVALSLVLHPWFWKRLDTESEWLKQLQLSISTDSV